MMSVLFFFGLFTQTARDVNAKILAIDKVIIFILFS